MIYHHNDDGGSGCIIRVQWGAHGFYNAVSEACPINIHITRFHVFFPISCTPFLHIPSGPPWFHQALPESPRRLKTLAKACSS